MMVGFFIYDIPIDLSHFADLQNKSSMYPLIRFAEGDKF